MEGMTELWKGYSFMFIDVTQTVTAQALSLPGSCWREFYTNPVMVCQSASCVSNKAEFNFWLPVSIPDTDEVSNFYPQTRTWNEGGNNQEILDKVSRCKVCVSDYKLLAVHSFSADKPTNQIRALEQHGWEHRPEMDGYSFLFAGGVKEGAGPSLQAHGSCMRKFTPVSVVQTNGQEVRWLSQNFASIWVTDYQKYLVDHSTDDRDIEWKVNAPDSRIRFREEVLGKCAIMKRNINRKMRYVADPSMH